MTNTIAKLGALLGASSILFAAIGPALAAPPPDVFRDSDNNVYIHGTTAAGLGSSARATTSNKLTRSIRAGYCGEIRIAPNSSTPSIGDSWTVDGSTTRTRANLVSITNDADLPRCQNANWSPTLPTSITTAGGFVDNTAGGGGRVVLIGFPPGVSLPVIYDDVSASIALRENQCGFVRIGNTQRNPIPTTITIGSTTHTVASLTVATPPLCRDPGTGHEMYTPASWN